MFDTAVNKVLSMEGGYSNNPSDPGGETSFGITLSTARAAGYAGSMKFLPLETAKRIYKEMYWDALSLDTVNAVSESLAEELFEMSVNMGVYTAAKFFQTCLNAFNKSEDSVKVDGNLGGKTLVALAKYMKYRKNDAQTLVKALNCLQGNKYLELSLSSPRLKEFVYGWVKNRVSV